MTAEELSALPTGTILACTNEDCTKFTTPLEARLRALRAGRCGFCGGELTVPRWIRQQPNATTETV